MLSTQSFVAVLFFAAAVVAQDRPAGPATAPAATQAAEAKLRVHTARISRGGPEVQKMFRGRAYNDGNAGVQLQLILTLADQMLPPANDAISIDTFVDDTFQSLMTGNRNSGYNGSFMQPAVSEDGFSLIFGVQAPRSPADDAERVFVRGSVLTRIARGTPQVETGRLTLKVGASTDVGGARVSVRSLGENDRALLNLNLAIDGDMSLVRKVRVLGPNNKVLQDQTDRNYDQTEGVRPSVLNLNVPSGHDEVAIEFTRAERIESVRIPFEAQIDLGGVKAGPIEVVGPRTPTPRGERLRQWPPPPPSQRSEIPARRPGMAVPAVGAATQPKIEKTGVDLFSIMIGKAAPDEIKGEGKGNPQAAGWTNPPAPEFRPAGFTVARLMLSTADVAILSVPYKGINVTKFEDDKGGKLDTTIYEGLATGGDFDQPAPVILNDDAHQGLLTLHLAAAPTPGATRCTIGGTVSAVVTRNPKSTVSPPLPLVRDASVDVGPYKVTVQQVRQSASVMQVPSPVWHMRQRSDVQLLVSGPMSLLRDIQIGENRPGRAVQRRPMPPRAPQQPLEENSRSMVYSLEEPLGETIKVQLRYHDSTETVTLPFEVSTGIGL
ncbi:MAG TPA: hypothetical protein VF624_08395 [Tepidisphaeraceae bacterium]|jgi:hypothetical protein